jgi:hypothetical protein
MEILGIHVFEQRGPIEWEEQMLAVNLLSALSWKKHHGKIHLYTNEKYLETLKKWGIDKVYDKIDTTTLSQIPDRLNSEDYWAFGKIHVSGEVSEPFVLLDTDLWINGPLNLDKSKDFIGYHFENFDEKHPNSPYINFDSLIPEKWLGRWDKNIMPINTALIWFNNESLKNEWIEVAKEIALQENQPKIEDPLKVRKMVLIEQRLIPMLAYERKLKYSTFIEPIYQSHLIGCMDGSEWDPNVKEWNSEMISKFSKIRHIWGNKKYFNKHIDLKKIIFNTILKDFEPYKEKEEYKELLSYLITK